MGFSTVHSPSSISALEDLATIPIWIVKSFAEEYLLNFASGLRPMLFHIQHSGEGPSMLLIRYIEVTFVFSSSERNEPDL